jgi:hypothetical protein
VGERGGLPWLYVGHLFLGLAAHWRGDWDEAERELEAAVELEPPAAFAGQSATMLAILLAHAGRGEDALAAVEERRTDLPVPGQVNSPGSWNAMFGLAEVLYVIGSEPRTSWRRPSGATMTSACPSTSPWPRPC